MSSVLEHLTAKAADHECIHAIENKSLFTSEYKNLCYPLA